MKLVILSRQPKLYSTRRLVEAGEAAGHEVHIVDHLRCNLEIERDHPRLYHKGSYLEGVDAVIPRVGASVTFYGTAVVRQFEMMGVFSAVASQALVASRDKLRSLQLLSRAGVGLPKTVFSNFSRDVDQVVDAVGGAPLILKLLEGTQGLGVILAESKNAAGSVMEAFNGLEARIIAQEFIKEAGGADIRALVVDGEVVGAMKRQGKEGEFRSNLHRGGSARVIELSDEERDTAVRSARAMGLGVAGVDMLQSGKGPLVLEVNSSPGLEGIEGATGVDVAGKVIAYVERSVARLAESAAVG